VGVYLSSLKKADLDHETGTDGKLYVWVDSGEPDGQTPKDDQEDRDQLIEFLRSELAVWQEESRRKDHIIAGLVERIPELEAPSEARESPLAVSEQEEKVRAPEEEKRSWWRRMFGP
jgi:hypothetical protein